MVMKGSDIIKELNYKGKKIPIIFRTYNGMNGKWF